MIYDEEEAIIKTNKEMNNVQKSEELYTKVTRGHALIEQQTEKQVIGNAPKLDYSEDEILTWL